jgi:murein L,D-transpeptidase YafK
MTAVALGALALAGCVEESAMPRTGRHYVPMSMEMQQAIREKEMRTHSPILIRAFKKESELEVWKQDSSGKMALLKTFPMCRWSGQLGPKVKEGDRQVPEGFYAVTPGSMNPNSSFYLSFNVGYPNTFDKQLGRTGAHIMVHGDCSSMGCFAMTDSQVADIYALTREAFAGGQTQVQLQSYPFRMTPENLARYRNDPHIAFWRNLKQGNDHFEVTQKPVVTAACNGRYNFGTDTCGAAADSTVASAVAAKQRQDEIKVAELVSKGTKAVKRLYRDGDMHPVFKETIIAQGQSNRSVGTTRNGISRTEAIAFTPIEVPVEDYKSHKSKGRTPLQIAELVQQEQLNAASMAEAGKTEGASTEPAKSETAKAEPAKAAPATATPARPGTAVASTQPQLPASASALTSTKTEEPQRSVFQRMMGSVGLGSGETETGSAKVEEITPHRVNVPLPPRRQASAPASPQARASGERVSEIISDTQRLAPASLAGSFSKLQ